MFERKVCFGLRDVLNRLRGVCGDLKWWARFFREVLKALKRIEVV